MEHLDELCCLFVTARSNYKTNGKIGEGYLEIERYVYILYIRIVEEHKTPICVKIYNQRHI